MGGRDRTEWVMIAGLVVLVILHAGLVVAMIVRGQ